MKVTTNQNKLNKLNFKMLISILYLNSYILKSDYKRKKKALTLCNPLLNMPIYKEYILMFHVYDGIINLGLDSYLPSSPFIFYNLLAILILLSTSFS